MSADSGNVTTAAATDEPSQGRSSAAGRILSHRALTAAWLLNVALLAGMLAWVWTDTQFMRASATAVETTGGGIRFTNLPMSPGRVRVVSIVGAAAAVSLAAIVVGLFVGAPKHRQIRSWLALTAMAAGWLTLVSAWPTISWAGQQSRIARRISAFEALAASLRDDWPAQDGASDALGPFNAYPIGRARMIMPLTAQKADGVAFESIERSLGGGLRFELSAAESGAWLEWHPEGEAPASFVGGLETRYELRRSAPLGDGWFLARYDAELDTGGEPAH